MLGKYIKINGTAIPNPTTYADSLDTVETVNTSEAGADLVACTRLDKYSASLSFQVTSFWKDKLKEYCKAETVELSVAGEAHTVRLRGYAASLKPHSERAKDTQGLWTVSCTASEL